MLWKKLLVSPLSVAMALARTAHKPAITKAHTAARSFPRFIPARVIVIMGVLAKEIVLQLANSEVSRWIPSPDFPRIDSNICIACGSCVKACPRHLIELRKKQESMIYVACNNKDKGIIARKVCSVACIGCGKCVKTCPEKAISLSDNLAYIDDNLCLSCQACVDGCPTHAIHAEIRNNIRETSTPRKETAIC